ncbi:MAG: hypothetical protein ABFC77_10805 [Thermoguttaceae bacterium]
MSDSLIQILEAAMLLCFGVSWPIDIVHTWRAKNVSGKSFWFMAIILAGYLAGIASKFLRAEVHHQPLEPVTWLYAANTALVAIDLIVSRRFRKPRVTNGAGDTY